MQPELNNPQRVVVTGIGAITPLGSSVEQYWDGLIHGRSGIRQWGLGSVADKVIHAANVPVWLVPAALSEGILYDNIPGRSILVPLDGSKLAEEVFPHVIKLTEQRKADTTITLVNVARPATVQPSSFKSPFK